MARHRGRLDLLELAVIAQPAFLEQVTRSQVGPMGHGKIQSRPVAAPKSGMSSNTSICVSNDAVS